MNEIVARDVQLSDVMQTDDAIETSACSASRCLSYSLGIIFCDNVFLGGRTCDGLRARQYFLNLQRPRTAGNLA